MITVVAIKEDENRFVHRTHVANLAKMHCSSLMTLGHKRVTFMERVEIIDLNLAA